MFDQVLFDPHQATASALTALKLAVAVALPLSLGMRERRLLPFLQGLVLSLTGGLFVLRTDAALSRAGALFAQDVHAEVFVALVSTLLIVAWATAWVLIPAILGAAVTAPTRLRAALWLIVMAAVAYVTIFVAGPLPGAVAGKVRIIDARAEVLDERHAAAMRDARIENALLACRRIDDLRMRLDAAAPTAADAVAKATRRLDRAVTQWGIAADATAKACSERISATPLAEVRNVVSHAEAAYGQHFSTRRLVPIAWVQEPAAHEAALASPKALDLRAYFSRAIKDPRRHVQVVVGELDFLTTWLLLAELTVAALAIFDALLARASPRATRQSAATV